MIRNISSVLVKIAIKWHFKKYIQKRTLLSQIIKFFLHITSTIHFIVNQNTFYSLQ